MNREAQDRLIEQKTYDGKVRAKKSESKINKENEPIKELKNKSQNTNSSVSKRVKQKSKFGTRSKRLHEKNNIKKNETIFFEKKNDALLKSMFFNVTR